MSRTKNTKQKTKNTVEFSTKSSIRDAIIADIHANKISPRPRWQYILLHIGLWISGIVTILLGSFTCAFVFLSFSLPERVYVSWLSGEEHAGWILALPYLWGIGMIFALTVGYFIFSHTGRAYRYHASIIALALVTGSIVGGSMLYYSRAAHWGDRQIQHFGPRYRTFREESLRQMPRPEKGLLPLRIIERKGDVFFGRAPNGISWEVHLKCDGPCSFPQVFPKKPVLFQGKIRSQGIFDAENILTKPVLRMENNPTDGK